MTTITIKNNDSDPQLKPEALMKRWVTETHLLLLACALYITLKKHIYCSRAEEELQRRTHSPNLGNANILYRITPGLERNQLQ